MSRAPEMATTNAAKTRSDHQRKKSQTLGEIKANGPVMMVVVVVVVVVLNVVVVVMFLVVVVVVVSVESLKRPSTCTS